MDRRLAAPLLALGLVLTAGCTESSQSGDSFTDTPSDQVPGQDDGVEDVGEVRDND